MRIYCCRWSRGALVTGVLLGVSCVKVQTVGETAEQRTESAEARGKDFRVTWVNRLSDASQLQRGEMLCELIDSLSSQYLQYGYRVADEWRTGNVARGEPIPDSEMRDIVFRWNETHQPLMNAYEEVLEYGIRQIKEDGYFGAPTLDLMQQQIDHYYELRSAVFYPSGEVQDYENRLRNLQNDMQSSSDAVQIELEKHR